MMHRRPADGSRENIIHELDLDMKGCESQPSVLLLKRDTRYVVIESLILASCNKMDTVSEMYAILDIATQVTKLCNLPVGTQVYIYLYENDS
jgi:hypothetical protein